jgi:hypothetical protein
VFFDIPPHGGVNRGTALKKLHEYLEHAAECRDMARTVSAAGHRDQLIQMAETWEQLAAARKRKMERDGKAEDDYPNEEAT